MRSGLLVLAFAFLVAAAIVASGCDDEPNANRAATPTATASTPQQMPAMFGPGLIWPVDIQIALSASSYTRGGMVRFELTFTNSLESPVTLHSFPPEVFIATPRSDGPLRSFAAGSDTVVMAKGEHVTRSWEWDQKDSAGQQVPNGRYLVDIHGLRANEGSMGWRSDNSGHPVQFIVIGDPAGNLVRTLEPGTKVEVRGAAIILDRIEFTTAETTVYARAIPPGYDFPEGSEDRPVMPPMSVLPFDAPATYSVDGAAARSAGSAAFNARQHDMKLKWTFDPVAATARSFKFTVPTIGNWDGPWEFTVDLE